MQDISKLVRSYMTHNCLSQAQLAKKAQVSQSTISRAITGKALRHGAARTKLFKYLGINESNTITTKDPEKWAIKTITNMLGRNENQAEAIIGVIEALDNLVRKVGKDGRE